MVRLPVESEMVAVIYIGERSCLLMLVRSLPIDGRVGALGSCLRETCDGSRWLGTKGYE